jgi:hypothetical protein
MKDTLSTIETEQLEHFKKMGFFSYKKMCVYYLVTALLILKIDAFTQEMCKRTVVWLSVVNCGRGRRRRKSNDVCNANTSQQ